MPTPLPTRLYAGHVLRVHSLNCVEVRFDLGFGISVDKLVVLEGISVKGVPRRQRKEANHCLVFLLGRRNVLVRVDGNRRDGYLMGRMYLDEKVYGDPFGLTTPFGLDRPRLEVSTFFTWLSTTNYDVEIVKDVLKGNRNNG